MPPLPEAPAVAAQSNRRSRRRRASLMRTITRNAPRGAQVVEVTGETMHNDVQYGYRASGLTAAAQLVYAPGTVVSRKKVKMPTQSWQKEVWNLRREVGEFRSPGDRTARAVSKIRLFIGYRDPENAGEDGIAEPTPVTADHPLAPMNQSMFGNPGQVAQAMRRAAQQLVYTGDTMLIVSDGGADGDGNGNDGNDTVGGHTWAAYSTSEVTGLDGKSVPTITDGMVTRRATASDIITRCWIPDPEYMSWADSACRSVLPVVRELVGLTKFISAQIDSRLAGAGLLIVPKGIRAMSGQVDANDEDTDTDEGNGDANGDLSFADLLSESMIIPVENRDSAASLVPFIAELEPELIEKIQYIRFDGPLDENAPKLRDEAIRRIALGMDSDPSITLGAAGANHWSAWQISEDEQKLVIEPIAAVICHALTTNWLQLVCRYLQLDPNLYAVWFDSTELKLRPDRSKDAQTLYDDMELSGDAARREAGFDKDDKPSDEEYRRRFTEKIILANPQLAGALLPDLGIKVTPEQQALIEKATGSDGSSTGDTLPGADPAATPPPSNVKAPPDTGNDPPPAAAGGDPVPSS